MPAVHPKTNTALVGIAGVHHVVSELSRCGLIALPTVKNTAAYDIVALNVEGTRHANIQVKTSSRRVSFFSMPRPEKIRVGRHDYFVLVRWASDAVGYECFLLSGKEARFQVQNELSRQARAKATRRVEFPCVWVGQRNSVSAAKWQADWEKWAL